ncbi:hypothetical protein TNCV_3919101 [Trichonephila clavipes]|nr:hypothetical protein TNCV_3919101 [Trichonephila clavipes]
MDLLISPSLLTSKNLKSVILPVLNFSKEDDTSAYTPFPKLPYRANVSASTDIICISSSVRPRLSSIRTAATLWLMAADLQMWKLGRERHLSSNPRGKVLPSYSARESLTGINTTYATAR